MRCTLASWGLAAEVGPKQAFCTLLLRQLAQVNQAGDQEHAAAHGTTPAPLVEDLPLQDAITVWLLGLPEEPLPQHLVGCWLKSARSSS